MGSELTYYQRNREAIIAKQSKYNKEKRNSDPLFKLSSYILSRFWKALRSKGYETDIKGTETLGCTVKELKAHLQVQFEDEMTWESYGKWHVDHIVPLSSAKTKEELCKLNHYTNLQPLGAKENLEKGGNVTFY